MLAHSDLMAGRPTPEELCFIMPHYWSISVCVRVRACVCVCVGVLFWSILRRIILYIHLCVHCVCNMRVCLFKCSVILSGMSQNVTFQEIQPQKCGNNKSSRSIKLRTCHLAWRFQLADLLLLTPQCSVIMQVGHEFTKTITPL